MSDKSVLLTSNNESTRILTLNRPNKLNAMSHALVRELIEGIDDAHSDETITSIIINAEGRAFSAGADIKEAATRHGDSAEEARLHFNNSRAIYEFGSRTDKPIIAAVHGYVLGGGCNLAISADMVVAGENAVFGYPEVKRGLAATMVTPGLVHRIGPKAAFELLTLAEDISATRALELGLINRIVPDDKILDEAILMAKTLAGFNQRAIRTTKRVFLKSTEMPFAQSLDAAGEAMLQMREIGK